MARKRYTADERSAAIALYATDGPTAVQTELGIPKGTVTKWAQAAGVETVSSERNAAAVEAARIDHAARREALAGKLTLVAEQAVDRELQLIANGDLRDVVGAGTRAIHDLLLLTGQATARHEHVTAESDVDSEIRQLTADLALNDRAAA